MIHRGISSGGIVLRVLLSSVLTRAALFEGGYPPPGVPARSPWSACFPGEVMDYRVSDGRLLRGTVLREIAALSPIYLSLSENHKSGATQ